MEWNTVPVCSLVQWGKSLTSAEVPHGPDRGTKLFAYKLSLAMRCSLQLKLWSLELHLAVGWSAMSCHVGSWIWVFAHLSCVVISFSCFDLKLLLRGWGSLRFYHQPTHSSSTLSSCPFCSSLRVEAPKALATPLHQPLSLRVIRSLQHLEEATRQLGWEAHLAVKVGTRSFQCLGPCPVTAADTPGMAIRHDLLPQLRRDGR